MKHLIDIMQLTPQEIMELIDTACAIMGVRPSSASDASICMRMALGRPGMTSGSVANSCIGKGFSGLADAFPGDGLGRTSTRSSCMSGCASSPSALRRL